jgi:hypothetical protein
MTYLLTWSCFGARVPGDEGAITKRTNQIGAPRQSTSEPLRNKSRALMPEAPWHPAEPDRQIVLKAIAEVCQYRNWTLLAAHFRHTHIHATVESESKRIRHEPLIVLKLHADTGRATAARYTFGPRSKFQPLSATWSKTKETQWLLSSPPSLSGLGKPDPSLTEPRQ